MKIYELTFTGTEKLFERKEVDCLPKDAEVVPFSFFNKSVYYSEKTGQYYYVVIKELEKLLIVDNQSIFD